MPSWMRPRALVEAGARELVIVAQDSTDYGRDWGEPNSLPRLLAAICNRTDERLRWVRLMYAYPGHVSDELIEVMASQPKITPYLDMPLQHGDPRTLRRMHRPSRPRRSSTMSRSCAAPCPTSPCAPPSSSAIPARQKRSSRGCSTLPAPSSSTRSARSPSARSRGRPPLRCPTRFPTT
jgi:hypothetical protein